MMTFESSPFGAVSVQSQSASNERPVVVGIDLSLTGTGVAVWDGDTLQTFTVATRPDDGTLEGFIDRCESLANGILNEVDLHADDRVAIEGLSYHSKASRLDRIFGSWWMVMERLTPMVDRPFSVVTPTQLKQYATGVGNAAKQAVLIDAVKRYPNAGIENDNEADATVLCAMIARRMGNPVEDQMPVKNLAVLEKVKWEA